VPVHLVLRLAEDINFGNFGVEIEAFAEDTFEFLNLARRQPGPVRSEIIQHHIEDTEGSTERAYLVTRTQFIECIRPLNE
jgi:hypothetical protein